MIGYLKGNLVFAEDNVVILSVNDVGYEIACSAAGSRNWVSTGGSTVRIMKDIAG